MAARTSYSDLVIETTKLMAKVQQLEASNPKKTRDQTLHVPGVKSAHLTQQCRY